MIFLEVDAYNRAAGLGNGAAPLRSSRQLATYYATLLVSGIGRLLKVR